MTEATQHIAVSKCYSNEIIMQRRLHVKLYILPLCSKHLKEGIREGGGGGGGGGGGLEGLDSIMLQTPSLSPHFPSNVYLDGFFACFGIPCFRKPSSKKNPGQWSLGMKLKSIAFFIANTKKHVVIKLVTCQIKCRDCA